jgi:hypothetical protein
MVDIGTSRKYTLSRDTGPTKEMGAANYDETVLLASNSAAISDLQYQPI